MKVCFQTILPLLTAVVLSCSAVDAATVNGGTLSKGEATQLETWPGAERQSFMQVWSGNVGVATASSFHSVVDGVGAAYSVSAIELQAGSFANLTGSSVYDGFASDASAFISNLTTGGAQFSQEYNGAYSIHRNREHFPTLGGGHDLFGGSSLLGPCGGNLLHVGNKNTNCSGDSSSHTYDISQGQITVVNDGGSGNGDSGFPFFAWSVQSLEVYTIAPVASIPVPLPMGLPMLTVSLGALGLFRRKRTHV